MSLHGRTAVITGAGSGIGRATAVLFSGEGAHVVAVDRDLAAAEETVALLKDGVARAADVSDAAAIEAAVAGHGPIHVLVNNAGVFSRGSVAVAEEDDWDRCMAVNVKGVFLTSRAALKHMDSPGAIVNIASVAGLVAVENVAAYCASKGAVIALTRSMATDLAARQIRVNCVCPGTVHTPLIDGLVAMRGGGDYERGMAMTLEKYPIGRLGQPEDIANTVLFLASEAGAFFTGAVLAADGGMTSR